MSRVSGVADQHDLAALLGVALALAVHLGDQGTGGVDHRQAAVGGRVLDRAGDAVGAEHRDGARRHVLDLLDELDALGAQPVDDVAVVDDHVAHVDRRAVLVERALDDLDRAFDPGTETPGLRQNDSHVRLPSPRRGRRPPRGRRSIRNSRAA